MNTFPRKKKKEEEEAKDKERTSQLGVSWGVERYSEAFCIHRMEKRHIREADVEWNDESTLGSKLRVIPNRKLQCV